jgi:Zn-dependent protease with chaperone function
MGERLAASEIGDLQLRQQIMAIDERIRSIEAAQGNSKLLALERRGLHIRLARHSLANPTPMSGLESIVQRTTQLDELVKTAEQNLTSQKNILVSHVKQEERRLGIGYGVIFLSFGVVLFLFSRGSSESPRVGTAQPSPQPIPTSSAPTSTTPAPLVSTADPKKESDHKASESSIPSVPVAKKEPAVAVKVRTPLRFPAYVSKHDLMTDLDAFYLRYLGLATVGDKVSDWPLVQSILKVSKDLIDAGIISEHLNEAVPVTGQPAFAHVQMTVDECAKRLGVDAPKLFVRQDPRPNAYVTRLNKPHLLVITSSLYDLYKDRPDEMRFIIGHELGHLKCDHIRCHLVGKLLIEGILGERGTKGIKEDFIAPLLVGQLLTWSQESEISADRSGLVCVGGDLKVAEQALLRLVHGTKEILDTDQVTREHIAFESEPFVKIARLLRASGTTHPFVHERRLALRQWTLSAEYTRFMDRRTNSSNDGWLVLDEIEIHKLPDADPDAPGLGLVGLKNSIKADPIVRAIIDERKYESPKRDNDSDPHLKGLGWRFPFVEGERLIIEVLDYDAGSPNDFIGSCILPISGSTKQVGGDLRLDIIERMNTTMLPSVTVRYRIEREK